MPGQAVRRASSTSKPRKSRAKSAPPRARSKPQYKTEYMYSLMQSAARTYRSEGDQDLILEPMFWSEDNVRNWLHGMQNGLFRTVLKDRPTKVHLIGGRETVVCDLGAMFRGRVETSKLADKRQFWYIVLEGLK